MLLHIDDPSRLPAADAWNAVTAVSIVLVAAIYTTGVQRLWRNPAGRETIAPWRLVSFLAGCGAAAAALLSVLDEWSDILFSAHMAQHELLMLVAAPLMVAGRPFIASMWAFPRRARESVVSAVHTRAVARSWDALTGPLTVLVLHALVLWIWHLPAMFEAALHDEAVHVVQHLGFFLTAALFWWALIHGRYGRLGYGAGVLYVFATAMHTQILGALLTFGTRDWYPTHQARTIAAGGNPLADQQLAGIVMWIPFGVVFLFIGLALFAAWLGEAERRVAFTTSERLVR